MSEVSAPAAMADPQVQSDLESVASLEIVQQILQVVCSTSGLRFSAVGRITDDRWIACAVHDELAFGVSVGTQLPLETTLCESVKNSHSLIVIDDVAQDPVYRHHYTPALYKFQSYVSAPIFRRSGEFFGTLCALDPNPRELKSRHIDTMFALYANLISMHLDLHERMQASETALRNERETARLRDQFIAVLGHDLRNPLAGLSAGAELLTTLPQTSQGTEVLGMMRRSTSRMSELVSNLMDFARGQLGGGLDVVFQPVQHLDQTLGGVVDELQSAWVDARLERDLDIDQPVWCDAARLAQMLSNLIANALNHGDPARPIQVLARVTHDQLYIAVTNQGETIPLELQERLFTPFTRGSQDQQGLGLGLFIACQIASAHHGDLEVHSQDGTTTFSFSMPLGDPTTDKRAHADSGVTDLAAR